MTTSTTLRRLAASTAVALAFSPLAHAAGLYGDNDAVNRYRGHFSNSLAQAAGTDTARERAGGFMVELEKVLAAPTEKTQTVVYPKDNSTNMLVVAAIVPPKGFEALPVPVCAQQHGKVLATWNITAKGEVIPRPAVLNPEGSTKAACSAFIVAARDEINQKLASAQPAPQPAQPPPAVTATTAALAPALANRATP